MASASAAAKSNIVNLEQIVRSWAWDEYARTATSRQKRLLRKERKEPMAHLTLKVDWSDATFHDETRWSRLAEDDQRQDTDNTAEIGAVTRNNVNHAARAAGGGGGATRTDVATGSSKPQASILFQTRFCNNTRHSQTYTMKTEKKTRTSMTTEVERGITKGIEMGINLKTPCELLEANVGYHREVTLTNVQGDTFEEEITWGVDSEITVEANNVAEASLVVEERKQAGGFVVETRVRGPIYFTFTRPRDNNSFDKSTSNYVAKIFREFVDVERRKGNAMSFVSVPPDDNGDVVIQTEGKCHFRYGVKQEIHVNQKPLAGAL